MTVITASEQRTSALEKANEVRMAVAQLRRDVFAMSNTDGRKTVANLLRDPPPLVDAITVGHLLLSIFGCGHKRIHKWLAKAGIWSEDSRVRELSVRQRAALADAIERWGRA